MSGHHIGVIASSSQNSELWTNLTHWWKMTETSGDIIDSHGTSDGTIGGGATQTSSGIVFDGTADWANISIGTLGSDNFTIILRINPTTGYSNRALIGGNENCFQLAHDSSYGLLTGIANGSSSTATSINMTTGSVQMIAVIRSGSTFRFFIESNFENETLSANFTGGSTFVGVCNYTFTNIVGTVRDVAVFSDAKSDAYITAFYNSGSYTDYEDGDPI